MNRPIIDMIADVMYLKSDIRQAKEKIQNCRNEKYLIEKQLKTELTLTEQFHYLNINYKLLSKHIRNL
jgi:hypothetical protein